jgi:hypothetical protein
VRSREDARARRKEDLRPSTAGALHLVTAKEARLEEHIVVILLIDGQAPEQGRPGEAGEGPCRMKMRVAEDQEMARDAWGVVAGAGRHERLGFACGGNWRWGTNASEGESNGERAHELRWRATAPGRPVRSGDGDDATRTVAGVGIEKSGGEWRWRSVGEQRPGRWKRDQG